MPWRAAAARARRAGWPAWTGRRSCWGCSPPAGLPSSTLPSPLWCAIDATVVTRGAGASSRCGISRPVSAKWPRWLVPNCSSKPSTVSRRRGGAITPALLTSRSSGPSNRSARACTDSCEARSSRSTRTVPGTPMPRIRAAAASPASVLRTASTTSAPCRASSRASTRPMPELAPVTRAVVPDRSPIWSGVQRMGVSSVARVRSPSIRRSPDARSGGGGASEAGVPRDPGGEVGIGVQRPAVERGDERGSAA